MDFLGSMSLLLEGVSAPTGLWANIINWLEGGIGNYAVVLILLTLMIKVIMLPFDFYNKYVSKKNMRQQAKIRPELEKINKRYANNKQLLNQKTMEVYKKNNVSMYGTCLGMLVYMALSLTVFFTLFSSLNAMSAHKIMVEYDTLKQTYIETVNATDGTTLTAEELFAEGVTISDDTKAVAGQAVVEKYGEIKTGFLWITNIWRPDTTAKATLSYDNFISQTKTDKSEISEGEYNAIISPIADSEEYGGANGLFLLAVITGLTSFGSIFVTNLLRKYKAKKKGTPFIKGAESNITMMIVMPIIMAVFTLLYNSAFGLYIVAGNIFSLLTSPFISLLVDYVDDKKAKKEEEKTKVSYSR